MRKLFLSMAAVLFIGTGSLFLTGCNNNTNNKQTVKQEQSDGDMKDQQLYACPMHPEVTGKKGDKCPKCGMKLTEPVDMDKHMEHEHE